MTERVSIPAERRRLWLCMDPVDTLFFRDGRPFDAAPRAVSGLPRPSVLAGALRTELLRQAGVDLAALGVLVRKGDRFDAALARLGGEPATAIGKTTFRGPYIGKEDAGNAGDALLYPVPASLRVADDGGERRIVRLDPLPPKMALPPGWTPLDEGLVPLWARRREVMKPPGKFGKDWITVAGMEAFLSGGIPEPDDFVSSTDLYGFEDRIGIAVSPGSGTADDGDIYGTRRLVLRPGIRFWACVEGPEKVLDLLPEKGESRLLPFGGEGRQASMTGRGADGPRIAKSYPPRDENDGRCLVLVAPALLEGWRPEGIALLSAAVPGHVAVSGWDLARGGPKPTRFAVPAGSIYFQPPGAEEPPKSGFGDIEDASLGWGDYLVGGWRHA